MKIIFTSHAKDKLKTKEIRLLKINQQKIRMIIKYPDGIDKNISPHRSLGKLNDELSLAIIWKPENGIIKIVTFYPAQKGRYERKLFSKKK